MIRRFLRSRGARKFRRNRLAMAAFCVIGVYFFVAGFVLLGDLVAKYSEDFDPDESVLGGLTVQRTYDRAGPDTMSGFFRRQDAEKRSQHSEFFLKNLERALEADDPERALRELTWGERSLADIDLETAQAGLDRGWELFDELDELFEELFEVEEEYDGLEQQPSEPQESELSPEETQVHIAELEQRMSELASGVEAKVNAIQQQVEVLFPIPDDLSYSLRMLFGTDRQGRSIFIRSIYSIKTAIQVGMVTALISVIFGSILGAAAAMFGGWVDHLVIWLYSTFSSIPNLVLLTVLAFMFSGTAVDGTMIPLYAAFCLTFWIGPCRVTRGEALKIKELEYVQAATAAGFGRFHILLKHVIPNTSHLIFINFSLLFIAAIKSEVILTFLGLGLKEGASWGIMINQSRQEVINGFFWQIGAATAFMFVLVLAFNIMTDALQDAFDPKHV